MIPLDGFSDPPYLDVNARGHQGRLRPRDPRPRGRRLRAHEHQPRRALQGAVHRRVDRDRRSTSARARTRSGCRSRSSPAAASSAITITPERVRILEAALEFGAAVSIDFGVASGGVSVMAGIYFRLEVDQRATENAWLTGYFRMRGEVDVARSASRVCIELYLELTYETATGKAVGRGDAHHRGRGRVLLGRPSRSRARRSSPDRPATRPLRM